MIQFEQPFRDGIERTKRILIPFDFTKWITLAFCSWLAIGLSDGFHFNYGYNTPALPGENPFARLSFFGIPWPAVLAGIIILVLAFVLLLRWIAARGRFMLLDNIVHDRALVVDPWKRFRTPANSLFLFEIIVLLCAMLAFFLIFICFAATVVGVAYLASHWHMPRAFGISSTLLLSLVPLSFLLMAVSIMFLWDFVVPVMYKTGCAPSAAALRVWGFVRAYPGDALLYVLVRLGLGILIIIIAFILCLATCCLGCLPFLFSSVTLPLAVFRQSFILDCLRQFDPGLDLRAENIRHLSHE